MGRGRKAKGSLGYERVLEIPERHVRYVICCMFTTANFALLRFVSISY
jgi:hypothetical protein